MSNRDHVIVVSRAVVSSVSTWRNFREQWNLLIGNKEEKVRFARD